MMGDVCSFVVDLGALVVLVALYGCIRWIMGLGRLVDVVVRYYFVFLMEVWWVRVGWCRFVGELEMIWDFCLVVGVCTL